MSVEPGARIGVVTGARIGVVTGARTGVVTGAKIGVVTGARIGVVTGARTGCGIGAGGAAKIEGKAIACGTLGADLGFVLKSSSSSMLLTPSPSQSFSA